MVTVISTFAGCGGSSLGYKWAGFKELLAIDYNKNAHETFKLNFDCPAWLRDIKTVTAKEILEFCNIEKGELDILDGSPPCQGFSLSGKRKIADDRNDLFKEFVRLIEELQPKVFVMENVKGMAIGKMKGRFIEIIKTLKALNYKVKCKIMNAKHYNVPQSRERLIFIGVRKDLGLEPSFPVPNKKIITVKDVLPEVGGHHRGQFDKKVKKNNTVGYTVTKNASMRVIKNGKECKLTIEECKRLCSFPDGFSFIGGYSEQWARLGNAVMPKFMQAIAENIKINILERYRNLTNKEPILEATGKPFSDILPKELT